MKVNRRRQPFLPAVPVARNLGGCSSEVSSSVKGRSSESSGMAERSASISRRRRTMSISFSRKTTFTSFTLTSSESLPLHDSTFGKDKFKCQIRDQYYKGGIGVRNRRNLPGSQGSAHICSAPRESSIALTASSREEVVLYCAHAGRKDSAQQLPLPTAADA